MRSRDNKCAFFQKLLILVSCFHGKKVRRCTTMATKRSTKHVVSKLWAYWFPYSLFFLPFWKYTFGEKIVSSGCLFPDKNSFYFILLFCPEIIPLQIVFNCPTSIWTMWLSCSPPTSDYCIHNETDWPEMLVMSLSWMMWELVFFFFLVGKSENYYVIYTLRNNVKYTPCMCEKLDTYIWWCSIWSHLGWLV